MFRHIFDAEHLLTPLAIEHIKQRGGGGVRTYRLVYVFGLRVAFYATTTFE